MGALGTALAKLAAVSVSGVTGYALGATPGTLGGVQLPALVMVPEWGGAGDGFTANQFASGHGDWSVEVVQVLLVAPVAGGLGPRGSLPEVVQHADAVIAALAADPQLDGALACPLVCHVTFGVVRWAGVDYHGATFRHQWVLRV